MKLLVASFILVGSCLFASAQQQDQKLTAAQQTEKAARVIAELAAGKAQSGGVKNSPFSAEEINESVQTLADGNRIVRSTTGKIYRNSAGRLRRDAPGGKGGMFGSTYTVSPGVTILDSAAGVRYHLDEHLKTAQQTMLTIAPEVRIATERALAASEQAVAATERAKSDVERAKMAAERAKMQVELEKHAATPMPAPMVMAMPAMPAIAPMPPVAVVSGDGQLVTGALAATTVHPTAQPKYETRTEDLGVQNYEGLEAKGTRTTTIIPAGAIGNERPIEIVYERWYSEELKMTVYSKRSDPRSGEQTYRLTNISRSEPDPSLFSVDGYRLISPKTSPVVARPASKGSSVAAKPVKSPYIKNFN